DLGQTTPASHGERIAAVPRSFIDCLRDDSAPGVTAQDGRVSVEMVLAAYQSAAEGRRVSLPLATG
ncbi:MAG TPA: gfo/Idh/MocA family oxidoreductase, partial [Caldilineaceae bacterium]|nr:gfo/Idh/MocA family oxidoreductase [Caldilineaceae bacterium]